jgi:PAS domain-containing protein
MAAGSSVGSLCLTETDFVMAVFKNLAVGVIVCDTKGHFVFVGSEAERILGIGAMHAELVAWSASYGCCRPDMVTPYPSERLPLARAMREEKVLPELIFIRN